MAQAALKTDYYDDEPQYPNLKFHLVSDTSNIDTAKIPRVYGAPAPRNKAEFEALMMESERQIENGHFHTFEEVFGELNAKYHFRDK